MPGATEARPRGAQATNPRRGSHGLLQSLASRLRRVPPAAQGGSEGASISLPHGLSPALRGSQARFQSSCMKLLFVSD